MLRPRPKMAGIPRPEVSGREPSQSAQGIKSVGVPPGLRRGAKQAMQQLARSRAAMSQKGHAMQGNPPLFSRGDAAAGHS